MQEEIEMSDITPETWTEPASELPVYGHFDVIVIGGGPAGFGSALAAARQGAKTLVVERFPYFGGAATTSLMANINGYRNQVAPMGCRPPRASARKSSCA